MPGRRFLGLAAVLVALNAALWLAPVGFALQQFTTASLFGKSMMRADVTENSGAEWRLDRGIVLSNAPSSAPTLLTIQEADSKVVPINVSSSTKVTTTGGVVLKLKAVKPGWHVLVTYPGPSGTAVSILVEKRTKPAA